VVAAEMNHKPLIIIMCQALGSCVARLKESLSTCTPLIVLSSFRCCNHKELTTFQNKKQVFFFIATAYIDSAVSKRDYQEIEELGCHLLEMQIIIQNSASY
jgi:hypothetical protein